MIPTPTPLPPGVPLINPLPESYSLWASTDYAIQSWNLLGEARGVLQIIVLMLIIFAGIFIFNKFVESFTRRDAEE